MKAIILKCKPNAQFRLGKAVLSSLEQSDSIIHSDTLFSALVSICALCDGDEKAKEFIEMFKNKTLSISSAFPCFQLSEEKYIYFLPKPEFYFDKHQDKTRKEIKSIKFVSIEAFQELCQETKYKNEQFICTSDLKDKKKFAILDNEFLLCEAKITDTIQKQLEKTKLKSFLTLPKIKVHSISQDDSFYHETNLVMNNLHFYFLIQGENACLEKYLKILADEGIGGGRSTGAGQIEKIIILDQNFGLPENESKFYYSLSLINPASAEEFKKAKSYEIVVRGGGSACDGRERKFVRMLSEGTVFEGEVQGKLVSLQEEGLPIYRCGKAFLVPIEGIKEK